MEVPAYIVGSVRGLIDKRTADVAARITGVPRRTLFRVVAGKPVRRETLEQLKSAFDSGTSGTAAPVTGIRDTNPVA